MPGGAVMRVTLFGKLPAHGDFVARGIGAAEREALDAWLSEAMTDARALLGDAFDDRYDRAPPWRFAGPDGAGVLVPSVDAAGRRYPLYLVLAPGGTELAARCEELIYAAFAEGWDADQLAGAAAALTSESGEAVTEARWSTIGGQGFVPAECAGERPPRLVAAMLASEEDA